MPHKLKCGFPTLLRQLLEMRATTRHNAQHMVGMPPISHHTGHKSRNLITQITETKLRLTPECCLLHINSRALKKYKWSLTKHMLNAAKSLIPLHWKSVSVPTIKDWLLRMNDIHDMEKSIAIAHESTSQFHATWTTWFLFKLSKKYLNLLNK